MFYCIFMLLIFNKLHQHHPQNVSCKVSTKAYLRVGTTRTAGDKTSESEYVVALGPLRGRLVGDLAPHRANISLNFTGWPEVTFFS